ETRPSRPDPTTAWGSTLFSSATRLAAGLSLAATAAGTAALAAVAVAAAVGVVAAGVVAAGVVAVGVTAAAVALSSINARIWPLVTVAPSTSLISLSTPATGAGTSSTTLSVSKSTKFSSRATASPGRLRQATSVAWATDSGSCGTRTSIVMYPSQFELPVGASFGARTLPAARYAAPRRPDFSVAVRATPRCRWREQPPRPVPRTKARAAGRAGIAGGVEFGTSRPDFAAPPHTR